MQSYGARKWRGDSEASAGMNSPRRCLKIRTHTYSSKLWGAGLWLGHKSKGKLSLISALPTE